MSMNEACGVFGCVLRASTSNNNDVDLATCVYNGLLHLQHRGQESAGIVTSTGSNQYMHHERGKGLVSQVFNQDVLKKFKGSKLGIGHTRYSTVGTKDGLNCIQPYIVHTVHGLIALAHNGELVNSGRIRRKMLRTVGLSTDTDSELIAQMLATAEPVRRLSSPQLKTLKKRQGQKQVVDPSNNRHENGTHDGHVEKPNGSGLAFVDKADHKTDANEMSENADNICNGNAQLEQNENAPGSLDDDEVVITPDWPAAIRGMMETADLAYSLLLLTGDRVYAIRDPYGNRPLCLGAIVDETWQDRDGMDNMKTDLMSSSKSCVVGWLASSESCAFYNANAVLIRDVMPGEIVELSATGGIRSLGTFASGGILPRFCIFEYVYFARSDSVYEQKVVDGRLLKGQQVYQARFQCGVQLGLEAPVVQSAAAKENYIVSTVPDSATPAALGYARATQIPYMEVLHKSRYEGRTFIQPSDSQRKQGVARKFAPLTSNYAGKSIVLIDDSIVRGNTMKPIVKLLKATGAKEVHIRIASPPLRNPCYMGINIPTRDELISNTMSFPVQLQPGENLPEFAAHLKADSVCYLSLPGLKAAVTANLDSSNVILF